MSQIRITKIVPGAPGTGKYNKNRIDCIAALDKGLLKHSAWLWDVKVGDKLQVPFKELEQIRENCKGLCEFELEHPKYCNQHVGSDVYPYEILEWKSERMIVVREMRPVGFKGPYDGHCESYESVPDNPEITLRERRNGGWNMAGEGLSCPFILSDTPYYYRDPSF